MWIVITLLLIGPLNARSSPRHTRRRPLDGIGGGAQQRRRLRGCIALTGHAASLRRGCGGVATVVHRSAPLPPASPAARSAPSQTGTRPATHERIGKMLEYCDPATTHGVGDRALLLLGGGATGQRRVEVEPDAAGTRRSTAAALLHESAQFLGNLNVALQLGESQNKNTRTIHNLIHRSGDSFCSTDQDRCDPSPGPGAAVSPTRGGLIGRGLIHSPHDLLPQR